MKGKKQQIGNEKQRELFFTLRIRYYLKNSTALHCRANKVLLTNGDTIIRGKLYLKFAQPLKSVTLQKELFLLHCYAVGEKIGVNASSYFQHIYSNFLNSQFI